MFAPGADANGASMNNLTATGGTTNEVHLNGNRRKKEGYVISWDRVHSQPDSLRVICVGAGAAGLYLAYRMQRQLTTGSFELIIYEKNPSIGGTWYENRYPGCACDVPAHNYTYSHRPNPGWSSFYAGSAEILEYFKDFAKEEDLYHYINFETAVESAVWNETEGKYDVTVKTADGTKQDWCHMLINAGGNLNKWKWPQIEGLHSFKGELLHSANYPRDTQLEGKRVAVIGTGSSAIQIIPTIQPKVAKLYPFIRSATWISPAVGQELVGKLLGKDTTMDPLRKAQHIFTTAEKEKFAQDPKYLHDFRHGLETQMNMYSLAFVTGTDINAGFENFIKTNMMKRLEGASEDLKKKLVPTWPVGCRRLTPGDGYLESLSMENVQPVFDEIVEVTETGLKTNAGDLHEVDTIICATGFNVNWTPAFSVTGRDGHVLAEDWKDGPVCYMAIAAPNFPNFYTVLGARGPWGNGPLLAALETNIDQFVNTMQKMQQERIKSLEVKLEPTLQLNEHIDSWHKGVGAPSPWNGSVWNSHCVSWYKMGTSDGPVWLWSGGSPSYIATNKHARYEDYHIEYKQSNQWAFLGNGCVLAERTGGDVAPYIRDSDTPWEML